ncbi:MAG: NUDIX domain-containing protein [Dehalococcoidia bacterium]
MTRRHTMPVAVHVVLVRDGEVLLLLRANTGYEDGSYSVIAGHVEPGEQIIDAAVREAREEAGIELDADALRIGGVMHRRAEDERIDYFVTAARWRGDLRNAEPEKCGELRWCARTALPPNTVAYVRRAIENGVGGPWFESFGWDACELAPPTADAR